MRNLLSLTIIILTTIGNGYQQREEKGDAMQIELDTFSGRENPTWSLNNEQTKEFLAKFESLEPSDSKKPLFNGLGYRGLRVTMLETYDDVRIWNTIVEARRNDKVYRWHDKDRAMEKYLLGTGKDQIDSSLYKKIASEIEKSL
jgi:hypothetical protein